MCKKILLKKSLAFSNSKEILEKLERFENALKMFTISQKA